MGFLDGALERGDRERLDHSPRWLRSDLHHLAEHAARARLRGWLHAGLDAGEAWESEDAAGLDLLLNNAVA